MKARCENVFKATESQCELCDQGCDMRLVDFNLEKWLSTLNPEDFDDSKCEPLSAYEIKLMEKLA